MIYKPLRVLLILLLIFISTASGMSQEWNSARISVMHGSSIPFNFNSLDKIKNGIEVSTGTRFGISMADSTGHVLTGFVLYCRTFNNQAVIKGDSYSLPLNRIRIKAENVIGLETGISAGYKDLTSDWVPLFTYTNLAWTDLTWNNAQLNIAYECGKVAESGESTSLLGEEPDYYNVEIEFELVPTFE